MFKPDIKREIHFTFSRSGGPGGQNVNKVSSRATLHWNVTASTMLPPAIKSRFIARFATRITNAGELQISSDRYRDQQRNIDDCRDKLQTMISIVTTPPKPRRATKPSRGAKEKRLKLKKTRSQKKQARRWRDSD